MPTHPSVIEFVNDAGTPIRVRRSVKRQKTISAAWKDGTMVVSVPAALTHDAERTLVLDMVKKLEKKMARVSMPDADAVLFKRARAMDEALFDGVAAPTSVRWVTNQNTRWGSASLRSRRIRLSVRLRTMPQYVQDYVLAHELAHLVEPRDGHGARFKAVLARYPRVHDANIFLSGVSHGYATRSGHGEPGATPGYGLPLGEDEDFDDVDEFSFDHS
ncbi:M48 family metallopeptidase [Arthrobacter sp. MYb227]|uniref:M48 family metallopeptidase n=1 Tax=Arthrobacter sp. MYb227 TaxID=1848601 RepID=UPI0015E2AD23|nr:M48 family metallopeptidase [Arthrobacter sp. MYb227]